MFLLSSIVFKVNTSGQVKRLARVLAAKSFDLGSIPCGPQSEERTKSLPEFFNIHTPTLVLWHVSPGMYTIKKCKNEKKLTGKNNRDSYS